MLKEYVALAGFNATQGLCLFLTCKNCASILEKCRSLSTADRKRVASIASPALTFKPRNFTRSTLLLCVATLVAALVTLDKNSLEAIETTRLLHGSMLTSHLRAMYDAAVKKCRNGRGGFGQMQTGD